MIIWLLEQTCCNIEQLRPLYVSQGLEYCRRQVSTQKNPNAAKVPEQREELLKILEQPEHYSLEKLYSPDQRTVARPIDAHGLPDIEMYVRTLIQMEKELRNTSDTVQALAHQEVEQECEVQIEVEQEREVKKAQYAVALPQPPLQKEVRLFAETGRLAAGSQAYQQAFIVLRHTALGRRLGINNSAIKSRLFVTRDFVSTIVTELGRPRDEYPRPSHWLLWSKVTDTAVVLSDFEADSILPIIRDREPCCTHLLTYAAPVTSQMIHFDNLKFYTVPRLPESWKAPTWLVTDLGILAGRLYFDYDEHYPAVCESLGLPTPVAARTSLPEVLTEAELWRVLPFDEYKDATTQGDPFSPNSLLFMQEWLAIRRKGQDFSQTMMGKLCRGRKLDKAVEARVEKVGPVEAEEGPEEGTDVAA